MSMFVCVRICVYACTWTCVYICMCIRMRTSMSHGYTLGNIWMCRVCICVCMYVCICVCTYMLQSARQKYGRYARTCVGIYVQYRRVHTYTRRNARQIQTCARTCVEVNVKYRLHEFPHARLASKNQQSHRHTGTKAYRRRHTGTPTQRLSSCDQFILKLQQETYLMVFEEQFLVVSSLSVSILRLVVDQVCQRNEKLDSLKSECTRIDVP